MGALPRRTLHVLLVAVAMAAPLARADVARSDTARVATAANAFLATLDPKQRKNVQFAFEDDEQRKRWAKPTGAAAAAARSGLRLSEMSADQRSAAMALVSSALSKRGFDKIRQIMEADELRKASEPNNPTFGRNQYYLAILGAPSETEPWMLQYGGHHLVLNLTIVGERGVLTPSLIGAQPALYEADGRTVRPLGRENDKAFALLGALDEAQRKQAILNYRIPDLVLGPGTEDKRIQPEGLKASAMNEKQRAMLLDLTSEWVGIAADGFAAARMEEIKAGLDETWFAWSGPTTAEAGKNGEAYFRIQGPKLWIEYAPQRREGDPTLHVHTIYRDPTNEYGRGLIRK